MTDLKQVVDYQLCCGCGLCAYLYPEKIRMADAPAFGRRPKFTEEPAESNTFSFALGLCPGVSLSHTTETFFKQGRIESLADHWGPVLEVWEGYATDPEIRFKGSSGGVLSAISLYCLEREGMHGVLHTTADDQRPYLNKTILSRSRNSLLAAAGSRYSPASPCEGLQEIEHALAPCVFIGKPCDVAAVQRARKHRPALHTKVGLTMACFCAGTPSTNGTLAMLRQMGIDSLDELVTLRYRGCGWPGKTRAEKKTEIGTTSTELTYEQSWGDILQKHRQWRCYICPDHTGEFADIATGDPWYREKTKNEQGRSLIVARTQLGQHIVEKAIAAHYLTAEKVDPLFLPASQPNLLKTRAMLWGRLMALKLFLAPCPCYEGFALAGSWNRELSLKEKMQSLLGTMNRIYKKRLKERQHLSFTV
ncbi:MAG: Coenzyme F420 hydrogenase/dehydrogenase, beta subunit C-terminal domain [Desulfobulbus sp.]|jgi:coenzyme F420 hydrogenase subunit beta|nr:Coenzyme F420 hydrogenase/dehydrogenase, beta subunit C-terminal domain [Desulfobulbus sp.]